jgi:DNA recombination protein RmuC
MSGEWLLALLLGAALGALVTALLMHLRHAERLRTLEAEKSGLLARGEAAQAALEETRAKLTEGFSALAREALRHNNEDFLRLAREQFERHKLEADGALTQKEQRITELVTPIREALTKTGQQIQAMEQARSEAYGSITQQIESMSRAQNQLQQETRNLVQALRRPEVRGRWGELTLRRLVELAGMVERCDFEEQVQQSGSEGSLRPDMVIRMPDGRSIVVDSKTPLDAYLAAMEASDDEGRARELDRHARHLRERARELSKKAYWEQFVDAPDFVVLFIPGEQFLSAALERAPDLLEETLRSRVILASPTSLIALLRAVAYGWRQLVVAENAEQIRTLGEELYKRLTTFTEHLARLGNQLGSSVEHYNKAIGSLERQVMPGARKFTELGISARKEIEALDPIEHTARRIEAAAQDNE